jgi:sarcosine oxidase subunit beta
MDGEPRFSENLKTLSIHTLPGGLPSVSSTPSVLSASPATSIHHVARTVDAVIVGGGIHGCSLAMNLTKKGMSCVVLEKDYVARHASGVNGGGVRTLGRHPHEIPLALRSAQLWSGIDDLLGLECGLVVTGQVRLAESEADLRKLEMRVALLHDLGYEHEKLIDRDVLMQLVPAVSPHCVGGLHVSSDGFVNPFRVTTGFRQRAAALGAQFVEGTRVDAVQRRAGVWTTVTDTGKWQSKLLFNCAGGWSAELARQMGDELPIKADGSMQIVTARLPRFLTPVIGSASRSVSIKQWPNGTVTIGGGHRSGVDLSEGTSTITPEKLASAAASAGALFANLLSVRAVRFWSGIEAFTPDGLPIIDRSTAEDSFHVTGFSAHGFQLAPIVGELVAEWASDGSRPAVLAPFGKVRAPLPRVMG